MTPSPPVVLIVIDQNSRLKVLRHSGVMIALLDTRVDPVVVILPEKHQPLEIDAAMGDAPIMSGKWDDEPKTAASVIARLDAGDIVVANLEQIG
jgi:hypothetical protein